MKKFTEIEWENVHCHLCGKKNNFSPISLHGSPLKQGQFGYKIHPVICKCGLVFLTPRWSACTYARFYEKYYDELYRLELKPDYGVEGVIRNMAQVWERSLAGVDRPNRIMNIIDIGCGAGHGLTYLKEQVPNAGIYGIEASPDCCRVLQTEVGAVLVDSDVNGPWLNSYKGKFDFVVMRHVVEHLLSPIDTLSNLKTVLAPGGMIYIAVPDMMHPRTVLRDYEYWWEYYFRAVHPYYYCRETLFSTLEAAGLYPRIWGEENEEVWCLAGTKEVDRKRQTNLFSDQLAVLSRYLPGPQKI